MEHITDDLKQSLTNTAMQFVKKMQQTHGLDVTLDVKETAKSITVTVKKVDDYVEPYEPPPQVVGDIEGTGFDEPEPDDDIEF